MPPLEARGLNQRAVYWPKEGHDGYGEQLVGDPEEVAVRWEWGRRQSADPQGNTVALDAAVMVEKAVAVGSLMALTTLAALPPGTAFDPLDPVDGVEVLEVATYEGVPDVRARVASHEYGLRRFRDALPGQA